MRAAFIRGRSGRSGEILGAIELPKDKEVRKALDILQARLEFAQHFNDAFGIVFCAPCPWEWLKFRV